MPVSTFRQNSAYALSQQFKWSGHKNRRIDQTPPNIARLFSPAQTRQWWWRVFQPQSPKPPVRGNNPESGYHMQALKLASESRTEGVWRRRSLRWGVPRREPGNESEAEPPVGRSQAGAWERVMGRSQAGAWERVMGAWERVRRRDFYPLL
ncbi:hypothetical protein [Phormidium sp. CCY1219]|uniref:hypothetical protein n=1 Tax=Phormidium sp. CCY1219 TaxID=2886104 RepID=UPI002D1EBCAF|nr:hypothetical protein [Phormidium sp. CCY1219]MEB3827343.1 hypothetical protein [Phormidium sp. CCY1219]